LTVARFPTLIAGGDLIVGEPSTRGTVPGAGAGITTQDTSGERQGSYNHARRCLADGTPTADLGGYLVDDGRREPCLEVCVYRYEHLPEGLRAIIDERAATRWSYRRRSHREPHESPGAAWAKDWFLADGTCITDLLAPD
jgi:hypothetical protein